MRQHRERSDVAIGANRMKAVVIGSGIGGLCVAVRLAGLGHHVVVLERNPIVGGKLADLDEAGYRFDLGPGVLVAPHLLDEVFRIAGTTLADEVDLVRLDPLMRCRWPDGSTLELAADIGETVAAIERFAPGQGEQWRAFATHAAGVWTASEQAWGAESAGGSSNRSAIFGRSRAGGDVDGKRTLAKAAASFFDDERLRQLVHRAAGSVGASPFRAPATLAGLWHLEQAQGGWHPTGGLGRLRDALSRTAASMGVELRTGVDVGRITASNGSVSGVALADGGAEGADIVVSDVDAAHLFVDLLPAPPQARQLDRVGMSASAFVLCVAVRGRSDGIAHRNVFFPLHDRQEHQFMEAGQLPIDQTVVATVSSVTDPSMAPRDCENWRVEVSVPPATGIDRKLMTAAVLNRLAERGVDVRDRIEFTRTLVPADFDARYRAPGGAIYGPSLDGKKAAAGRPANIGPADGLYLVGGSARPGGALPHVMIGARTVADLVAERHA